MSHIEELRKFYKGRRVLVTGHTGFKGSWLCVLLSYLGAEVYGYALEPDTEPSLFSILYGNEHEGKLDLSADALTAGAAAPAIDEEVQENAAAAGSAGDKALGGEKAEPEVKFLGRIHSHIGDIRNFDELKAFFEKARPEVVIHLAAQPIVRESYRIPRETYEINVMGTVNVLECVRLIQGCRSVLNVTTDKVYLNEEREGYGYREDDKLDGYDPYSNSKSCSELVTHSYKAAFFDKADIRVSTARAGNVIGGGDFAKDRIIPDFVRAVKAGTGLRVRNPYSTRPYQHVLEPLFAYLYIAMRQWEDSAFSGWYNVGPDDCDCVTTGELCDIFVRAYGAGACWHSEAEADAPHEASFLKLDNQKLKDIFGLHPVWHIDEAVRASADWTRAWIKGDGASVRELISEIERFGERF